jgi:hypothetical protein
VGSSITRCSFEGSIKNTCIDRVRSVEFPQTIRVF